MSCVQLNKGWQRSTVLPSGFMFPLSNTLVGGIASVSFYVPGIDVINMIDIIDIIIIIITIYLLQLLV